MEVRRVLELMLDVNEIDRDIRALEEQLELYPGMLAKIDAEQARADRGARELDEKLKATRETRRKLDLDMRSASDKVTKLLTQQSQVKTNKEYQAITAEITRIKDQIDEMETRGLAVIDDEDRLEEDKKKAAVKGAEERAKRDEERQRIQRQTEEKRARIEALGAEREKRVEAIPESHRELYEKTSARYPGEAVVKTEAGACTGCGMRLAPQVARSAQAGESILQCEFCRRILC